MNDPNGWQRLWIVLTVIWVGILCVALFTTSDPVREFKTLFLTAVLVPMGLYGLGVGVAWIRRGFK